MGLILFARVALVLALNKIYGREGVGEGEGGRGEGGGREKGRPTTRRTGCCFISQEINGQKYRNGGPEAGEEGKNGVPWFQPSGSGQWASGLSLGMRMQSGQAQPGVFLARSKAVERGEDKPGRLEAWRCAPWLVWVADK